MFNRQAVLGVACVAAITPGTSACGTNPPAPHIAGWKEIAIDDGRKLGLEDPHVTDEDQQIKMTSDRGCPVYLTRVSNFNGQEVTIVTVDAHGVPLTFNELPTKDNFEEQLEKKGC